MKYKVGDSVRVRYDLKAGTYGQQVATDRMCKLSGMKCKIVKILQNDYMINIDDFHYYNDGMLMSECSTNKISSEYGLDELLEDSMRAGRYALINKALDERDEETFNSLTSHVK